VRELTEDEEGLLELVGHYLDRRHDILGEDPGALRVKKLNETECAFLALDKFRLQIFGEGYSGFLCNGGDEFAERLPAALEAIGASRLAQLARQANDQHRRGENISDSEMFDVLSHHEEINELMLNFAMSNRWVLKIPWGGLKWVNFRLNLKINLLENRYERWQREVSGENRREKASKELDKKYATRKCPKCKAPCPNYRKTCKKCGHEVGRIVD